MPRKASRGKKAQPNNRVKVLQDKLLGTESSDEIMSELAAVLRDTEEQIPVVNGIYVFTYYAQKPNLLTDRYPIVGVTGVYDWGFSGMNLHIGEPRNYNFTSAASGFYKLKPQEVATARALPLMYLVQNR